VSDVAAGPIVLGEMPLGRRIAHDGLFAGLLEPVVDVLRASESVLGAQQRDIATNSAAGLDATYATTIGAAEAETAGQPNVSGDQTAPTLVDAGGGAEAYRGSALPFLPQPSAPIGQTFQDFPVPDFGHPGGTGGEPGDPNKD
jgi:hypothetical protein